jgi:Trehalose utilisation
MSARGRLAPRRPAFTIQHPMIRTLALSLIAALTFTAPGFARTADGKQKLVFIAGKPSHPPRQHEFNAGVQLLAKCLAQGAPNLHVDVVLNGWPKDEAIFDGADGVVFYLDGNKGHEVVQEEGRRLAVVEALAKKGVGIGCMHYAVEIVPEQAGDQFKRWIGGHYEHMYSCNPMWEPEFTAFPKHPITSGVGPFKILDEWYFNMRFADEFSADGPKESAGTKFQPILVAKPGDEVRKGPYVYPKGPYDHIVAASGRAEAMMWAVERPDGGRGFGFTGGHWHDNWGNDDFRKTVLNALVWVAKGDVPAGGIASTVTKEDLDANLDPKPEKKKKK